MDKILPPIEYFYGRTPLAVWISNCKPFVPREVYGYPDWHGLAESGWFISKEDLSKFKRAFFKNQFHPIYERDKTEYKMSDEMKAQKVEDWKIIYLNQPVTFKEYYHEDSMSRSRSLLAGRATGKTLDAIYLNEAIKLDKEAIKSINLLFKLNR